MKKLKIAQIVSLAESVPPISQNGLEFIVSWLTEELVKRGHDVTLFAPADSKTNAKLVSLVPTALNHDKEAKHPSGAFLSIWNTLLAGTQNFDIIHCHNLNGTYLAPFVSTPIIETSHGTYDPDFKNVYIDKPKYSKLFKPVLEQLEKVHRVYISKNQVLEHAPLSETILKKHTMIHNGIPVEKFTFNDKPQDYLFFIGYINKNKGADVAVRVAKKMGMKLILAGNTFGEEAFFEEHIKPYLDENIQYVGPVDFETKNKLYMNSRATLAPLHWAEPFGLTLAESQACGTPVIAFRKGAAPEIIQDGTTGFIVDTEEEMINAVQKIDSIDRKACRAWIENNFSVQKMVDQYEDYYISLLI